MCILVFLLKLILELVYLDSGYIKKMSGSCFGPSSLTPYFKRAPNSTTHFFSSTRENDLYSITSKMYYLANFTDPNWKLLTLH
jgi:hypothetical protein